MSENSREMLDHTRFNTVQDVPKLARTHLTLRIADISGANSGYAVCPVAGIIKRGWSLVSGDPGANTVLTFSNGSTPANAGTLTIANGASAEDIDDTGDLSGVEIQAGEFVQVVSDAAAVNAVSADCTVEILRFVG